MCSLPSLDFTASQRRWPRPQWCQYFELGYTHLSPNYRLNSLNFAQWLQHETPRGQHQRNPSYRAQCAREALKLNCHSSLVRAQLPPTGEGQLDHGVQGIGNNEQAQDTDSEMKTDMVDTKSQLASLSTSYKLLGAQVESQAAGAGHRVTELTANFHHFPSTCKSNCTLNPSLKNRTNPNMMYMPKVNYNPRQTRL